MYRQSNKTKKKAIHQTWIKRLEGCDFTPDVWLRVLRVCFICQSECFSRCMQLRAIVLPPLDNMNEWVAYSDLCRKASVQTNNTLGDQRCKDVLEMLLGLLPA